MTKPEIVTIKPRKLVGAVIQTTLAENRTKELWQGFGPKIRLIKHRTDPTESWSVEIYEKDFKFSQFTPQTSFEKGAAVEVSEYEDLPEGLKELEIPGGTYAVFSFKGLHSDAVAFLRYIYGTWIPDSEWELDDRPHFGIMGAHYYGPFDAESEEDFWVPVRKIV